MFMRMCVLRSEGMFRALYRTLELGSAAWPSVTVQLKIPTASLVKAADRMLSVGSTPLRSDSACGKRRPGHNPHLTSAGGACWVVYQQTTHNMLCHGRRRR